MGDLKKVYFYKVSVTQRAYSEKMNYEEVRVKPSDIYDSFKELFELVEDDKDVVCPLELDPDKTIAEFITLTDTDVFGRIGKEEDINYLRIRRIKDSQGENLKLDDDTYPEKCTYFYYNFKTGILSYISIGGAPRYSKFERILAQIMNKKSYNVNIIAVINKDAIGAISKKSMINNLSVKVSIPCDEFLGLENLGLSKKDFADLNNVDYLSIELTLHGKRYRGITDQQKNKNYPLCIFKKIKETAGNRIKHGVAKGFNPGEKTHEYDLIEDMVTNQIELPERALQDVFIKRIEESLKFAYNEKIETILQLSR